MQFRVITAVADDAEPITLADAKVHLRVDGSAEDDLITALIVAARETAEHYAGRAFAEQTLEAACDAFPACGGDITLPMGPVESVSWVRYTGTAGAEQSFTGWALSGYGSANRVSLEAGQSWPSTQDVADAVRIQYVTGAGDCPRAAVSAMLLILGNLYENRGDAQVDIPPAARALLDTVKVYG